jgi:hypothetical protein
MQPHVTFFGLAALFWIVTGFAYMSWDIRRAIHSKGQGWLVVLPSWQHWFGFLGSAGFSALTGWTWLFTGSARHDADSQMWAAFLLTVGFGTGANIVGYLIVRTLKQQLRIKGSKVAFTDSCGIERDLGAHQVEAFRETWSGYYQVLFDDGTILLIDKYAKNSVAFLEQLFGSPELAN